MKIFSLAAILLLTPVAANATSGFCAATYQGKGDQAVITVSREIESEAALKAEFQTLLKQLKLEPNLQGCVVSETADDSVSLMRRSALDLSKLGFAIEIVGW